MGGPVHHFENHSFFMSNLRRFINRIPVQSRRIYVLCIRFPRAAHFPPRSMTAYHRTRIQHSSLSLRPFVWTNPNTRRRPPLSADGPYDVHGALALHPRRNQNLSLHRDDIQCALYGFLNLTFLVIAVVLAVTCFIIYKEVVCVFLSFVHSVRHYAVGCFLLAAYKDSVRITS